MPHRWSDEHAGTIRNGWTLRRDCLTCGVEHWIRKREGRLPMVHEYRSHDGTGQRGASPPLCSYDTLRAESVRVEIVGNEWRVFTRPRGGVSRLRESGREFTHALAVRRAGEKLVAHDA